MNGAEEEAVAENDGDEDNERPGFNRSTTVGKMFRPLVDAVSPATMDLLQRSPTGKIKAKENCFLPGQNSTRKQMIEYLSLLKWGNDFCIGLPLAALLWLVLLASVSLQANTEGAFSVRSTLYEHILDIKAVPTKGVAPKQVYSEPENTFSYCTCICGKERDDLCSFVNTSTVGTYGLSHMGIGAVPLGPGPSVELKGTVMPSELQMLRGLAAQQQSQSSQTYATTKLQWKDIDSIDDVWFWIQHGLIPDIFHDAGTDRKLDFADLFLSSDLAANRPESAKPLKSGQVLMWNQMIAGLRMRQLRVMEETCLVDKSVAELYAREGCYGTERLNKPFGPGTDSYAEGFLPDPEQDGAFDVFVSTDRPLHISLETMEHVLHANNWLDGGAQELVIHAMLLNAEAAPPLFGLLVLRFEFERSGGVKCSIDVLTSATEPYPNFAYLLLDLLWVILILQILVRQVRILWRFVREQDSDYQILRFWDLMDWFTILLNLAVGVFWLIIASDMMAIKALLKDMPAAPPFGATPDAIRDYTEEWGVALNRMIRLMEWRETHRLTLFWCTLALTMQFFRVFRGQPRLAQMSFSLKNIAGDVLHFLILFLVFFLNFAWSGYMIFGLALDEWSTPMKAVSTSLRTLVGDSDVGSMYEIAPISTLIWFTLFLLAIIFIMTNILVATVFDHYEIAKNKAGAVTGIIKQVRVLMTDQFLRSRNGLMQRCCRCRNSGMMNNGEILENVLDRAILTKPERQMAKRSVLGPRFLRKALERELFTGQTQAIQVGINDPVQMDLEDLNLDEEHMKFLLEQSVLNSKRETAPDELETAQLRELVARAEGDIAEMRDRMMQCQANVKESMHVTQRRLENIEDLIHHSLAELALIAGAAGVPDKKGGNRMVGGGGFLSGSNFNDTKVDTAYFTDVDKAARTGFRLHKHLGTTGIGYDDEFAISDPALTRPKAPGPSQTSSELRHWEAAVQKVKDHANRKRFR
jgi:hypothetical protein